jgi:hypothetical protein
MNMSAYEMCGQCGVSLCELCHEYYYPSSGEEHVCSTNATCPDGKPASAICLARSGLCS